MVAKNDHSRGPGIAHAFGGKWGAELRVEERSFLELIFAARIATHWLGS